LHQVFLLQYLAFLALQHVTSSNPIMASLFRTVSFCSIQCISLQAQNCDHSLYLLESELHKYIIQLMSVRSPVAFQVYRYLLGFLNHVLVTESPFLSQKSVSIWNLWFLRPTTCFISNQNVPVPHYDGVCRTFSIFFENFFDYTIHFLHFDILRLHCWHLQYQNTYRSCF
jgi:hypothetical protein